MLCLVVFFSLSIITLLSKISNFFPLISTFSRIHILELQSWANPGHGQCCILHWHWHCTALQGRPLYCTALHCTALHCTKGKTTILHCTALKETPLDCTVLNCIAQHCIAHCTAIYFTSVPCTSLQCNLVKWN